MPDGHSRFYVPVPCQKGRARDIYLWSDLQRYIHEKHNKRWSCTWRCVQGTEWYLAACWWACQRQRPLCNCRPWWHWVGVVNDLGVVKGKVKNLSVAKSLGKGKGIGKVDDLCVVYGQCEVEHLGIVKGRCKFEGLRTGGRAASSLDNIPEGPCFIHFLGIKTSINLRKDVARRRWKGVDKKTVGTQLASAKSWSNQLDQGHMPWSMICESLARQGWVFGQSCLWSGTSETP